MYRTLLLLLAITASVPVSAETNDTEHAEISYLLKQIQTSDCRFNRNGTWHTAQEAATHLKNKYAYLSEKGLIITAETFIEKAASKSSTSGKPYIVQCGTSEPIQSSLWFMTELSRYRHARTTDR